MCIWKCKFVSKQIFEDIYKDSLLSMRSRMGQGGGGAEGKHRYSGILRYTQVLAVRMKSWLEEQMGDNR